MAQKQKSQTRQFYYFETNSNWQKSLPEVLFEEFEAQGIILHQNCLSQRQELPLGQTKNALMYDIWSGFHPDTFVALSGCIKSHGWVALIGPPLQKLPLFQDPDYAKISNWPQICPADGRYLKCLQQELLQLESETLLQVKKEILDLRQVIEQTGTDYDVSAQNLILHPTEEQAILIDTILQDLADAPATSWYSLFANRGVGKTTLLQFLVQKIQTQISNMNFIYVTDNRCNQDVFQQAVGIELLTCMNLAKLEHHAIQSPTFIMIDECAKYNLAMLEKILVKLHQQQVTLILSTSLDGYEGSAKNLNRLQSPQPLTHLKLGKTMRWSQEDPLAKWIQSFFHAETFNRQNVLTATKFSIDHSKVQITKTDPFDRAEDWMKLMSLAHYRTRPSDLRLMMDGQDQHFWILEYEDQLIGGLWASMEGPIADYLHEPIQQRTRRVKGHLAPQFLEINGYPHALHQHWLRIVRIALLPEFQHQGLGTLLMQKCRDDFPATHLAVSYKPDQKIQAFWTSIGFQTFKPGFNVLLA